MNIPVRRNECNVATVALASYVLNVYLFFVFLGVRTWVLWSGSPCQLNTNLSWRKPFVYVCAFQAFGSSSPCCRIRIQKTPPDTRRQKCHFKWNHSTRRKPHTGTGLWILGISYDRMKWELHQQRLDVANRASDLFCWCRELLLVVRMLLCGSFDCLKQVDVACNNHRTLTAFYWCKSFRHTNRLFILSCPLLFRFYSSWWMLRAKAARLWKHQWRARWHGPTGPLDSSNVFRDNPLIRQKVPWKGCGALWTWTGFWDPRMEGRNGEGKTQNWHCPSHFWENTLEPAPSCGQLCNSSKSGRRNKQRRVNLFIVRQLLLCVLPFWIQICLSGETKLFFIVCLMLIAACQLQKVLRNTFMGGKLEWGLFDFSIFRFREFWELGCPCNQSQGMVSVPFVNFLDLETGTHASSGNRKLIFRMVFTSLKLT